ncbi:MAG: hypothetical protein KatS3mg051_1042 [Anaerolineae bacterium]|nr:MAG: hypothetical protein KatS3mg051_1042 [Anaerolineae bacterium]
MEEKRITIRTTTYLHERVSQEAARQRRSLNAQIEEILETYFDIRRLELRLAELKGDTNRVH